MGVLFFIFFYQIYAGNPGIYIYSRGATGNLYCSGTPSVYKVKPIKMALNIYVEGFESPPLHGMLTAKKKFRSQN